MEHKLLTQHSSLRQSSWFLKVINHMEDKRNLCRSTLECNRAFLFIYTILPKIIQCARVHGSVAAFMWTLNLLSECEGRSWMSAGLPALCSGEDSVWLCEQRGHQQLHLPKQNESFSLEQWSGGKLQHKPFCNFVPKHMVGQTQDYFHCHGYFSSDFKG